MASKDGVARGRNVQLPFGLRDGRLWGALDVERGLGCGCRCPGCHGLLVARQGAGNRRAHFSHYGSQGHSGCFESALHRFAKHALVEGATLRLPCWHGAEGMPNPPEVRDEDGVLHWGRKIDRPARVVETRGGRIEVNLGTLRPDVVVEDAEGEILVEVCVSHPVEAGKATLVRERGLRMVEIDLSNCPVALLVDPEALGKWIREDAPRHWIWEPGAAFTWAVHKDALDSVIAHQAAERWPPVQPTSEPMDWDAFRRLFEEREITPIGRPPFIDDPLIGCWVWVDGGGAAEIAARLSRKGGVYRVRLEDGTQRIFYLGRD